MEGEPKLMDKVFDKFAQWADWSEKDPVREIIFVICTHIVRATAHHIVAHNRNDCGPLVHQRTKGAGSQRR